MKHRLTVYLKDGREISGVYDLYAALARLSFAEQLPDFKAYTLAEVR